MILALAIASLLGGGFEGRLPVTAAAPQSFVGGRYAGEPDLAIDELLREDADEATRRRAVYRIAELEEAGCAALLRRLAGATEEADRARLFEAFAALPTAPNPTSPGPQSPPGSSDSGISP